MHFLLQLHEISSNSWIVEYRYSHWEVFYKKAFTIMVKFLKNTYDEVQLSVNLQAKRYNLNHQQAFFEDFN